MADLRRIFSQLFERVGSYLSEDAPHGDARALLLAEARALRAHFSDMMKAYDAALDEAIKSLDQDKDHELMAKAPHLRAELQATRRALYRSILARQDKQALVTELNEWKQHKHLSKGAESLVRNERMEMLESELRSRQVEKMFSPSGVVAPDVAVSESAPSRVPDLQVSEPVKAEHHLPLIELWKSLQPPTEEVIEAWSAVLKKAHHPELDPRTSVELVKSFKQAQGAIKQSDRQNGVTRDRLEVFQEIETS